MENNLIEYSAQKLWDVISDRINNTPQKCITFADYMDLALYHPQLGYYGNNAVNMGSDGDFFTSPHLGNDFGELLAEQFVEMWQILGKPKPFTLVEMGAGQGWLARDILRYLEKEYYDFFVNLEYIIVEKSLALINKQKQTINIDSDRLRWCDWDDIPLNSIIGCFFSNELVDAFPVHQIILKDGKLQEIYVTINPENNQKLQEIIGELSTPRLEKYLEFIGINLSSGVYTENYRSEVNLAALNWLDMVASRLKRGYLLTIDYGYTAERYYHPSRQGNLQCYYRHQHHNDPYIYLGEQDITTHVNFTALERQGELRGLEKLGFIQQGLFLMALGLGDRLASLSSTNIDLQNLLKRRDALHQLIEPMGLGGFGVLIQSKGLRETEKIQGLKSLKIPDYHY